jgi:acetyl esterase/lipase
VRAAKVWRADRGQGSAFYAMVASNQIFGRMAIVWSSRGKRTAGGISIRFRPKAARRTLLTPGNFEVEHVSLARNRRDLLYSSNQDDIDRRHVWRVAAAGGSAPAPILGKLGEGLEVTPEDAGDGAIAYLRAGTREIIRATVKIGGTAPKDLAPDSIPSDFPANDQVVPQQVIFPAADGMTIHGQLFVPKNPVAKNPAIVFFHGGSRRQMLLGWHYMYYYSNTYAMNQYLASKGYIVLSVNYRSGIGYGLNFREAINYGSNGGSEYNDVIGAGLYLASRPDVDAKRIGAWGGSYGGYLTAMALARGSDLFAAGVDLHGVHDWSARGGRPNANAEAARIAFESSPMASVKTWKSPVLLIHGDDDRNVDFGQTVRLVEALRRPGDGIRATHLSGRRARFPAGRALAESDARRRRFLRPQINAEEVSYLIARLTVFDVTPPTLIESAALPGAMPVGTWNATWLSPREARHGDRVKRRDLPPGERDGGGLRGEERRSSGYDATGVKRAASLTEACGEQHQYIVTRGCVLRPDQREVGAEYEPAHRIEEDIRRRRCHCEIKRRRRAVGVRHDHRAERLRAHPPAPGKSTAQDPAVRRVL